MMIKYVLKDGEMVRTCTCSCGWTDEDIDDQVCVKGWRDGTYIHVAVDGQTKTLMIKYVLKDGEMVHTYM